MSVDSRSFIRIKVTKLIKWAFSCLGFDSSYNINMSLDTSIREKSHSRTPQKLTLQCFIHFIAIIRDNKFVLHGKDYC